MLKTQSSFSWGPQWASSHVSWGFGRRLLWRHRQLSEDRCRAPSSSPEGSAELWFHHKLLVGWFFSFSSSRIGSMLLTLWISSTRCSSTKCFCPEGKMTATDWSLGSLLLTFLFKNINHWSLLKKDPEILMSLFGFSGNETRGLLYEWPACVLLILSFVPFSIVITVCDWSVIHLCCIIRLPGVLIKVLYFSPDHRLIAVCSLNFRNVTNAVTRFCF